MTPKTQVTRLHDATLFADLQAFFNKYVVFTDNFALPHALWVMLTYMFQSFDCFAYVVVTAATKRAGKTRFGIELTGFVASKAIPATAMSGSAMFRKIEAEEPTILFDEAEGMSSEASGNMRMVLNSGYRKGSVVSKTSGEEVHDFKTFCPKLFVLIGDVNDTLRDRAIIVRMRRSDSPARMSYTVAQSEGAKLSARIKEFVAAHKDDIEANYANMERLEFMNDRDEELWLPLFALAKLVCPKQIEELKRVAVDMATEKTQAAVKFTADELKTAEDKAQRDEYAARLLNDMAEVMNGKNMGSVKMVEALKELTTSPWRKFRGTGLTADIVAELVQPFGLESTAVRVGTGKHGDNKNVVKGYSWKEVKVVIDKHNPKK
jgi:hypothetical protein